MQPHVDSAAENETLAGALLQSRRLADGSLQEAVLSDEEAAALAKASADGVAPAAPTVANPEDDSAFWSNRHEFAWHTRPTNAES